MIGATWRWEDGLEPVLASFTIAGFEGADHRNSQGRPVEMLEATGHAAAPERDYARVRALGIHAVRESVGWRRSERDGRFDFSCAVRRARAAQAAGVEVAWTLWHYGLPDDLSLHDAALPERFARFARAAAEALAPFVAANVVVSPVNEISFLAWAVSHSPLIHPYRGQEGPAGDREGYAVKRLLVHATLRGCDAIRAVLPGARLLHIDPLVHVVPPAGEAARAEEASAVRAYQFQAWDMLTGRSEPALGGHPRYLDLVGVNYYHANQFELDTGRRLHWHLRDPRRIPFRRLLLETHARYDRPLIVAETSHFGITRGRWLADIAFEVERAAAAGARIGGLCLYPVTDRPDWEQPTHWHHSGLWDRREDAGGAVRDVLDLDYAATLRAVERRFPSPRGEGAGRDGAAWIVAFIDAPWDTLAPPRRTWMAALARRAPVLLVAPAPVSVAAAALERPAGGLAVLSTPLSPADAEADPDTAQAVGVQAVVEAIAQLRIARYAAWLETTSAYPLLQHLAPDAIVYAPDDAAPPPTDPRHPQRAAALRAMSAFVFRASPLLPPPRQARAVAARIDDARRRGLNAPARAVVDALAHRGAGRRVPRREPARDVDCLIVGAGLAGLAAAARYGPRALLVEREARAGGSRRAVRDHGFRFEAAAAFLDAPDERAGDVYGAALGANVVWRPPCVDRWDGAGAAAGSGGALRARLRGRDAETPLALIGVPQRGGVQALVDGLVAQLRGEFFRGIAVTSVDAGMRIAALDDGRRVRYRRLLWTPPLTALVAALGDHAPRPLHDAAMQLVATALRVVNLGVRDAPPVEDDWILVAGEAPFDRVVIASNLAADAAPRGAAAIACEMPHGASQPLPSHGTALIELCIEHCRRLGLVPSGASVAVAHEIDTPHARVADRHPLGRNAALIERWLDVQGIAWTGSRGGWDVGKCHASIVAGRTAAIAAKRAVSREAAHAGGGGRAPGVPATASAPR